MMNNGLGEGELEDNGRPPPRVAKYIMIQVRTKLHS